MRKSLAFILLALSTICASFACSSKSHDAATNSTPQEVNPPNADGSDPGNTDPATNNNTDPTQNEPGNNTTPDGGAKAPTNQTECIASCETTYPTAATDSHELDNTCFFGAACGAVCDDLGQGESKYPGGDAGAKCDTAAAGSFPIGTPSQACSDCLASTATCCTLWIKIFGSAEGQSLNKCANDCWAKFPN